MTKKNQVMAENNKSVFKSAFPIVVALFLVMCSVAYIVGRSISERAYNEKWKDYDECGLS